MKNSNIINIFTENISLPFDNVNEHSINFVTENILNFLNEDKKEVSIILCNNSFIRDINSKYRNKDYPTDVISFAFRDDEEFLNIDNEYELIGDVFLSLEQAKIQFKTYSSTFEDEVKRLLVHSILHLLGYDHERNKRDAEIMFKLEDEIISKLEELNI